MKIISLVLASVISVSATTSVFAENPPVTPCPSGADIVTAQYVGPYSIGPFVVKGVYDFSLSDGTDVTVLAPSGAGTPTEAQAQAYLNQTTTSWTPDALDNYICTYKPGGTTKFSHISSGGYIVWLNAGGPPGGIFQAQLSRQMTLSHS
jgi:hypothetical protein